MSARSGADDTVVVAEAELLAGLGSASLALTVAVLVTVPTVVGVALTVTVAAAPEESDPRLQVSVPEAKVQLPWVEDAELKPTPAGRASVTTTPVAAEGPLSLATTV
jgi:hypothetical protein